MGLEIGNVVSAFAVLDNNGDEQVSLEEFVEGAWYLKGQASAIETAKVRVMLEEMKGKVEGRVQQP
eukprot:2840584-Pyramimonas_sp.AAC.1